MALTDEQITSALPRAKEYKLFDGRGLYIEVDPSGGKWWRLKYKFAGKEKRLSLGVYPEVGINYAKTKADDARGLIAQGLDPSAERKKQKAISVQVAANTFEAISREWLAKVGVVWADSHRDRLKRRLERDIFPVIGNRPISDITRPELLRVLARIEDRGSFDTAHRALGNCGKIFRYAMNTGRCKTDITAKLVEALTPATEGNFAAVTDPERLSEILRVIDGYVGTLPVRSALRLAPLVFVRPGELRHAKWTEISLRRAEWNFELSKRRRNSKRRILLVPLSKQAVSILRELHIFTGQGTYVFPGYGDETRPMSENAVLAALRRLGIGKEEMSGHGFRATARTILAERLKIREDLIEHQLGHIVKDPNGTAYNRTTFLPERRDMMQRWSDYLDALKAGEDVDDLDAQVAHSQNRPRANELRGA